MAANRIRKALDRARRRQLQEQADHASRALQAAEEAYNLAFENDMTSTIGNASPATATSPRLPSPPPFPEVQIGPKSPGANNAGFSLPETENASPPDQGASRRIRPGTKAADMASGPPLIPLSELNSPFQLQEHLKALHWMHTRNPASPLTTIPISHETALLIANPPANVDRSLWLYELTRFLVQRANDLIVAFFRESPPCSAATCPEMRASEWQYLCAVHEPPKSCCAMDYSCHTLDWAATTLTSPKQFPSRLTLGNEALGGSSAAVKQLTNIMRRVYRIFAHAWFQHRGVFWQVEGAGGLYMLFKTACDVYSLIPEDNYTIPREAEGLNAASGEQHGVARVGTKNEQSGEAKGDDADDSKSTLSTGATTRRHKSTPSVGSSVNTIQEGDEDEKDSESPVKEDRATLVEALSHSTLNEAPLASISKAAEGKELEPPAREETGTKAEELKEEAPMAVKQKQEQDAAKEEPAGEKVQSADTKGANPESDPPAATSEEKSKEES